MSMPLPGEIRYPSTAAHREMCWERENRAILVSEVTHRAYRDFRRTWGSRGSPCGAGSRCGGSGKDVERSRPIRVAKSV
jgi:hypothetical protein